MCELMKAEQCVLPLSSHTFMYRARLLLVFAFLRPKLWQRTNTDNTSFVFHQNHPSNRLLYPRQTTHAWRRKKGCRRSQDLACVMTWSVLQGVEDKESVRLISAPCYYCMLPIAQFTLERQWFHCLLSLGNIRICVLKVRDINCWHNISCIFVKTSVNDSNDVNLTQLL